MNTIAADPGYATAADIEAYLRVESDKRRELFKKWGLPNSRLIEWSEIWCAVGLDRFQPKKLWNELQAPLLDNQDVAAVLGCSVDTINTWCRRDTYPKGFPYPIRLGARKKLWVPLEIRAYFEPHIYAKRAKELRRPLKTQRQFRQGQETLPIGLDPLTADCSSLNTTSHSRRPANLLRDEASVREHMIVTTEEMVSELNERKHALELPSETRHMDAVVELLEREIKAGEPVSSRQRAQTALRSLLNAHNRTLENTDLSLALFDSYFPITGWNPVEMPTMTQLTYLDYRKRARGVIKRTLGISQHEKKLRARVDRWTEVNSWLRDMPNFASREQIYSSIISTLTLLAREHDFQPEDITQCVISELYRRASSKQRNSLRNAARLISGFQSNKKHSEKTGIFFPNPIKPIHFCEPKSYQIPGHFHAEINEMVKISIRKKYIKIRRIWENLSDKTRKAHLNALRATVSALMATGHLNFNSNSIKSALADPNAIEDALGHILSRVDKNELQKNSAGTILTYLPPILERNGIQVPELRADIKAVPEFALSIAESLMPLETQNFCKALIQNLDARADFLLSHAPLRAKAEAILALAKKQKRNLTIRERTSVRQLGTVALFCAIECGGAPIRIENFLEIPVNGPGAWLNRISKDEYKLSVPANKTKNKKPIVALIVASQEQYHDTVRWFLAKIRPLFFFERKSSHEPGSKEHTRSMEAAAAQCSWLVPGVKNPDCSLPYTTFLGWFKRLMRNVVGLVCDPHNFRHGQ